MTDIRTNAPSCVKTYAEQLKYQELYDDLMSANVYLSVQDRHALGVLACLMIDIETLRDELKETGFWPTVSGDKGSIIRKKNPVSDILDKKEAAAFKMFKAFQMTPESHNSDAPPKITDDGFSDV